MTRRGRPSAITRQVTPNGSVMAGPEVWPEEIQYDRTREIVQQLRHDGSRGRIAGWFVALRQLADDDGGGS